MLASLKYVSSSSSLYVKLARTNARVCKGLYSLLTTVRGARGFIRKSGFIHIYVVRPYTYGLAHRLGGGQFVVRSSRRYVNLGRAVVGAGRTGQGASYYQKRLIAQTLHWLLASGILSVAEEEQSTRARGPPRRTEPNSSQR